MRQGVFLRKKKKMRKRNEDIKGERGSPLAFPSSNDADPSLKDGQKKSFFKNEPRNA